METRKAMILAALDAFVHQRSGIDYRDYYQNWTDTAGVAAFRAEQRTITRDLHDYRQLRRTVELRDNITADDLVAAFANAFSGRLSIYDKQCAKCKAPMLGTTAYDGACGCGGLIESVNGFKLSYVTGQYFPTEYRKAACAVMASALWARRREDMPTDTANRLKHPDFDTQYRFNGAGTWMSAGDWLRTSFRREFGRGIASRWFS